MSDDYQIHPICTPEEQAQLMANAKARPWRTVHGRKVQHHGWVYDRRKATLGSKDFFSDMPDWIIPLADRLPSPTTHDQMTVDVYPPSFGMGLHRLPVELFEGDVCIVVLGSAIEFVLVRDGTPMTEARRVFVEAGHCLCLGEALRAAHRIGIIAQGIDIAPDGKPRPRGACMTLTLRHVSEAIPRPANIVRRVRPALAK